MGPMGVRRWRKNRRGSPHHHFHGGDDPAAQGERRAQEAADFTACRRSWVGDDFAANVRTAALVHIGPDGENKFLVKMYCGPMANAGE